MPPENIEAIQKESLIRIVDDDAEIRETLSLMLEIEGWRTHAYPGAEAFLVGDQPSMPGVLLLDIEMGGMNGLDLQIEMMERGYSLPIIFITGHASVDAAVDAMRRGARDFLQKPVDPDRLLSSLTAAARESVLEASHALGPRKYERRFRSSPTGKGSAPPSTRRGAREKDCRAPSDQPQNGSGTPRDDLPEIRHSQLPATQGPARRHSRDP